MATALLTLLAFVLCLVLLDLVAGAFGVDSRDGFTGDSRH